MTTAIIIGVLTVTIVGAIFIIVNQRVKIKESKEEAATEKHKKETLKQSVDNVLMAQEDSKKMKAQTLEHVEILKKTKEGAIVEKEFANLRDDIFGEYARLRNN